MPEGRAPKTTTFAIQSMARWSFCYDREGASYGADFGVKNKPIVPNNAIFMDVSSVDTEG